MSTFERLRESGRRITWRTILGLILVPLTAAGVLLWGLWNPTERLGEVTAAVVNLDEAVTVDGQLVPLGRVLAGELIGGEAETNFTWILTDEADAEAGLSDGRYATVVTIPQNFSAAATSVSGDAATARPAVIDVRTSERGRLLDAAISGIVTTTATRLLNEQLGSQYVGNIFVGMTALGDGLGEAASGAHQLADGGSRLANGASELATGTVGLADGIAQLSGGLGSLASGATDLASGARAAAAGGAELADGVAQYTGMVNSVLGGVIDSTADALPALRQVRDLVAAIPEDVWPGEVPRDEVLAGIDAAILEFEQASSGDAESMLVQLYAAGQELSAGAAASAAGQGQLAGGMEGIAGGLRDVAANTGEMSAGAAQLADGSVSLADGSRQTADGILELAKGLDEAASGIPSYTDAERDRLAETMVTPVTTEGGDGELFNASGVPLFAGIALWAGALASFLVLAPLWRRTREAARGIAFVTARSIVPALIIGAAQGLVAGVLLPFLLGYGFLQGVGFAGLAVLAGVAFSLVNQGLSALFGGFGRFLSFALLVVAFAIGVISTAPPVLQVIGDASPIGALFEGFQAIAMGTSGAGIAVFLLVLWGGFGALLTAFAASRARKRAGEEGRPA